jgi:hypothetical protein
MVALPANASSALTPSQNVLVFEYEQYVRLVPRVFSKDSTTFPSYQNIAIDERAVHDVSKVHIFYGSLEGNRNCLSMSFLHVVEYFMLTYHDFSYSITRSC